MQRYTSNRDASARLDESASLLWHRIFAGCHWASMVYSTVASEGWVVCGTRRVRWNRLVFGLVKAYKTNLTDEQITKLDPMRVMFQFWVNISSVSNFKVWPHRRWLNSWFKGTSALSGKWMALLDCMEDYGWKFIKAQLALAATIATTR